MRMRMSNLISFTAARAYRAGPRLSSRRGHTLQQLALVMMKVLLFVFVLVSTLTGVVYAQSKSTLGNNFTSKTNNMHEV